MAVADKKFGVALVCFQVFFLILFFFFAEYDDAANASALQNSRDPDKNGTDPENNHLNKYYPMFQDVHVMIFIGFGFLMTFLKRYGFSSVGINMLVAAFVLQWGMLCGGLVHHMGHTIHIDILSLLTADFAAAAVLISFGAVLGKTSPLQLIIMAFIEIIIFSINETIGLSMLQAVDVGGSMFVHVFGAYFGLALSRVIYTEDAKTSNKEGSVYHSDIFAMVGTVFLWLYWPSFNSALAPGDDQHRAVINTYLALAACCVTAFAISALVDKRARLDMVHVQNATLAGGVAVGTTADMMIRPWGAVTIGILAGTLSVLGYKFLSPMMADKLKIHDTCGVNNLHGMPGIFAGIAGIVASLMASTSSYGYSLYQIFPARAPMSNSTELLHIQSVFSLVEAGSGRSAMTQAMMQSVALTMTLVVAIIGGALTGLVLKLPFLDQPREPTRPLYDDSLWWETPEDFGGHDTDVTGLYKGSQLLNHDGEDEEAKV